MSKVKAPTGMTISRSGTTFKVTWKKGDSYSTMQYKWGYVRNGKEVHMSTSTTSATHVSRSFSAPVSKVILFVRGKKSGNWSDWSRKAINIYEPLTPTLSQELIQTNKTTYTWEVRTDNHDRPISGAKVENILVRDCPAGTDALASLKEWKTEATTEDKSANDSITPVNGAGEDSSLLAGKSYARVVRVKEYGLGGESKWEYIKHVYAAPKPAENVRGVVRKTEASLNCEASWQTPSDAGHPIDSVVLQYAIATPETGMQCPDEASWTSLPEQSDTSGVESKYFTIGSPIGLDKCLFLQVVTTHDTETVESIPVLATDGVGALTPPTFTEAPSITSSSITIKAENNSAVADSFVVDYLETADGNTRVLGLHNTATKVYQVSNVEGSRIGLKAFVGTWDSTLNDVRRVIMQSNMTWSEGSVPVAPAPNSFKLLQSIVSNNTVDVTWNYSWSDADACEISWSTEPDAWVSTDEPEYYIVLKGLENKLAIKGVEAGEPLYVRLRYVKGFDDNAIFSPYSDIETITISTVPAVPTLVIDKTFYAKGESINCNWVYITSDGTKQAQATISERLVSLQNVVTYREIASVTTAQNITFKNSWAAGTTHYLVVKVANGSGNWSEWSDPVAVTIAEQITCTIDEHNLTTVTGGYELQSLPLTVTVTGAGTGGETVLMIKRAADYRIERPEGEDFKGHEGEVVFQRIYSGEAEQEINFTDTELKGHLDDGASYILYASIQDEYGQFDDDEVPFTVNWQYKAVKPTGSVSVNDVATITIGTPTGTHTGDFVDIYRNSIDGTELIYTGAEFGGDYIDPYPAIGNFGYLLVGRNAYGDFITSDNGFAWTSIDATYESEQTLIDFNGERISLEYNVDVSHSWDKDFQKTKYLGGAIVGDFIVGVERTGTINAVSVPIIEESMLESMRRLAVYQGVCHVRTKDGSSFSANIQVTEDEPHDKAGYVRSFSLSIEKIDPVELDGMTSAEWEAQ